MAQRMSWAITHHWPRGQLPLWHYRDALPECPQELGTSLCLPEVSPGFGLTWTLWDLRWWPEHTDLHVRAATHEVLCVPTMQECGNAPLLQLVSTSLSLDTGAMQGGSCITRKAKLVTACTDWVNGPLHKVNLSLFKHFKHGQTHGWLQKV